MSTVADLLDQALSHHRAGQLGQAEQLYRQILRDVPHHADAWHFLGLLTFQMGQAEIAVEYIGQAIALGANHAGVHLNLGRIHEARGRLEEACASFEHALRLQPDSAEACLYLGGVCRRLGRLTEAEDAYQQALRLKPDDADAHNQRGICFQARKSLAEAEACFRQALRLRPDHASAHNNLGMVLEEQGRLPEAQASLEQALRLQPDWAMAHNNLGVILQRQDRQVEALTCFQQAVRLQPGDADAQYNLGQCLRGQARLAEAQAAFQLLLRMRPDHAPAQRCLAAVFQEQGLLAEAQAAYRQALRLQPDDAEAHHSLGDLLRDEDRLVEARDYYERALALAPHDGLKIKIALLFPTLVPSHTDIPMWRDRLQENLNRLNNQNLVLFQPHLQVGAMVFFPLAYHGLNDRDLVSQLATLYARSCPSLSYVAPHCRPTAAPPPPQQPLRIGFLSTFFHTHSVGRYYGGIIQHLARPEFRVIVFQGARAAESLPRAIQERADAVVILRPQQPLAALQELIAAQQLDVLFYPDIGMHPLTYFLAFARLAPVQCVAGGHPVTTGIPTLDYFISSRDPEPADAHGDYSERLVQLESPFHYFEQPQLSGPPGDRRDFELPEEANLYLCVQHLFKIHPDFDALAAAILRADPTGRLVLVQGHREHWSLLLRERLQRVLGEAVARVQFVPWQPYERYLHLLTLADVLLDTPHFNGGVTTLQALGLGLPMVTLPGAFLRGRQTYGCYRRMGVLDCVAADAQEYVRIAVRLATEPAWREQVRARIRANNQVLFEDVTVVRELEEFFRQAVASARACRK
jgi:predicted O-linked N-acetylglucosamine transferase (SPINDLY family)